MYFLYGNATNRNSSRLIGAVQRYSNTLARGSSSGWEIDMKINSVRTLLAILMIAALAVTCLAQAPAAAPAVKQIGALRQISGSQLTLVTDQGASVVVNVQPTAKILRITPGQTDLKSASILQLSDLQTGDRVMARGRLAADGTTLEATVLTVMKASDIALMKQKELQDWQRRGVGGVVKQVDAATGAITLTVAGKTVTVTVTPKTTYKRYAANSVRWEDVAASTLADVHAGDQLRAKGDKAADGTQLTAEEVVVGTFRNLSGRLTAVDTTQNTLTLQDLATKKTITVVVTEDSQMKKLPQMLAYGLAARLKGLTPGAGTMPGASGGPQAGAKPGAGATPPAGVMGANGAAGGPPNGAPGAMPNGATGATQNGQGRGNGDLNAMLGRLPAATLAELQKGEAVMILCTQGSETLKPSVITLLGGVEPILTASPAGTGSQSFLTPWSLAGGNAPGADQ